jgi:Putative prokaryotic signal transducing protein
MENEDGNSELVMVAQFLMEQEFLFARGRLESAGIECFCANEYLSRISGGMYNGMTGGIELKVKREDLADARAILNDPGTPYLVR